MQALNYAINEGYQYCWKGALVGGTIGYATGYSTAVDIMKREPSSGLTANINFIAFPIIGFVGGTLTGFVCGVVAGSIKWAINGPITTDSAPNTRTSPTNTH